MEKIINDMPNSSRLVCNLERALNLYADTFEGKTHTLVGDGKEISLTISEEDFANAIGFDLKEIKDSNFGKDFYMGRIEHFSTMHILNDMVNINWDSYGLHKDKKILKKLNKKCLAFASFKDLLEGPFIGVDCENLNPQTTNYVIAKCHPVYGRLSVAMMQLHVDDELNAKLIGLDCETKQEAKNSPSENFIRLLHCIDRAVAVQVYPKGVKTLKLSHKYLQ